jgi:hypothetical protein
MLQGIGVLQELEAIWAERAHPLAESTAGDAGGAGGAEAGRNDAERSEAGGSETDESEAEAPGITTRDVTLSTLEKAREFLEEGRLEEAERAVRIAERLRSTSDKLEMRDERLRLLFEEKLVAAAEARKKAVTPGFYPDRDPDNYEEKIGMCGRVILRLSYLQRRTPASVEMEHSAGFGFRWPGADAPWFKTYCMEGRLRDDPAGPVRRFEEAHPDTPAELTEAEQAEVVVLKDILKRWGTEVDPFIREYRIAEAARRGRGEWMSLKRHSPELWKGLAPAPIEE